MKVALTSGAYEARSLIADCQRCVNLYPENNPSDSPFPTTHYPTAGLRLLGTAPTGVYRCLYPASNGALYAVIGSTVYQVTWAWGFTPVGTIGTSAGPVSMADNTQTIVLVDGTANGYTIDLASNGFAQIVDDAFYGGDRVDFVDGFLVLNRPGTNQWYCSGPFAVTWDPLDFASKTGAPDLLSTLIVANRYVYLLGEQTTEIWYDAGNQDFTFGRMPGAFIQHGIAAKASAATMDGAVYWLAQDPQGHAVVMRTSDFNGLRISTHAMEHAFQGYSRIDDATGYTYQLGGHFFYVLTFPTADKTWVFDLSTNQWHEWLWMDAQGQFHQHRGACFAFWQNQWLVGDRGNGNLYALDPTTTTDNGAPIVRLRSFPHLVGEGNRIMYRQLIADMQVGQADTDDDPQLSLRWSDTRGASWGNAIQAGMGAKGQYLRSIQFQRLGYARDRVFELSWSTTNKTALNGAFVQVNSVPQ